VEVRVRTPNLPRPALSVCGRGRAPNGDVLTVVFSTVGRRDTDAWTIIQVSKDGRTTNYLTLTRQSDALAFVNITSRLGVVWELG